MISSGRSTLASICIFTFPYLRLPQALECADVEKSNDDDDDDDDDADADAILISE